jgi:hypothetical protein
MKKFYLFNQSNPGGYFIQDDKVDENVIIHAESAKDANRKAQEIGIYFNGVRKGIDCGCCNDRWYPVSEYDSSELPLIDGEDFRRSDKYKIYADEEWVI